MKLLYPAIFKPLSELKSGYCVVFPDLPGCVTQGDSLENALEIHLLDSVWGAFIYQLDAKYNLFQNKKIFLYAKRGHIRMFKEPIKLKNWIII
jgi:predicted RNase H-like HicB family nuclease